MWLIKGRSGIRVQSTEPFQYNVVYYCSSNDFQLQHTKETVSIPHRWWFKDQSCRYRILKATSNFLDAKQPAETTLPLTKQSPHGLNRETFPVGNLLTMRPSGCRAHPPSLSTMDVSLRKKGRSWSQMHWKGRTHRVEGPTSTQMRPVEKSSNTEDCTVQPVKEAGVQRQEDEGGNGR